MHELIKAAFTGDKFSIAKLVSYFESVKPGDQQTCVALEKEITSAHRKKGLLVGLTGAPGAGKSTLIQHLVDAILSKKSSWHIAVVAVDPSSPVSGGSLLGDRTRVNFGDDERTYFRSQASDLDLGGIGRNTYRVCRLLRSLFDLVIIESVGVGQSEIEIAHLADLTLLALQPFTGDHIQFMKSGIMEIPQAFVITKCDAEDLAQKSLYQLQSSLEFLTRIDAHTNPPAIFQTSSQRKIGFAELADFVSGSVEHAGTHEAPRENYFLKKEIRYYYGQRGIETTGDSLTQGDNFEERRLKLLAGLAQRFG